LANGLDNADLAWSTQGAADFDPTYSASGTADFVANTIAHELGLAAQNLETAASDDNYTIDLTAAETGGSAATADAGDLKLIASGLHLLRSFLLTLSSNNWDAELGMLHEIDNSIYLDPQSALATFPNLFTLESLDAVPDAKAAFIASEADY